jgi:integrase
MITPSTPNAPAARERPGAGTERSAFDATTTLLLDPAGEVDMSGFEPIEGHPGFYRLPSGSVTFRYRDRRRRRRWASAPTIKAAEREKIRLEEAVESGEYRVRSRLTFASYARSWIDSYAGRTARGISETTRDDYRRRLEDDAIPYFGEMRLSEIEPQDVKAFARALEKPDARKGRPKGLAPNTVRLAVAPVRALLATAVEEGVLRSNPVAGLRLAQRRAETLDGEEATPEQVKAMSEQELAKLLAAIARQAPEWRLFFDVLAWSGLRIGEMVELRWKDVDLGERIVHVRRRWFQGRVGPPKSRYGKRKLKLPQELARALWLHRGATRALDEDLVFSSGTGARVQQSNLMTRVLKPAAVEAGLGDWVREGRKLRADTWVGFHSFRHTCATVLFRRGWNAVQVQRWLGHHKPSFTLDTYVHLLDEDVPEPAFFDALTGRIDHFTDQGGPKPTETEAEAAERNPSVHQEKAS